MYTHGVSSSASSETTDIFHLRGFLKLFLIYFTIYPSPILQRNGSNIEDVRYTALMKTIPNWICITIH